MIPDIVTINVTQEDIDTGRKFSCIECPIARAATRVFPGKTKIGCYMGVVECCGEFYTFELPVSAHQFILSFDLRTPSHRLPVPFSFTVNPKKAE